MKGDFSKWRFDPKENFAGVLYQQGRVFLDRDGIEQTRISNHWQDQAARDAFGAGVAAAPASEAHSFKVQRGFVNASGRVALDLTPGRLWADGLLSYLPEDEANPSAEVSRVATYLQPPLQDPPAGPSTIAAGIRDAVILELWREAFNGFQDPEKLIEAALGGPDTTERVHTAMRFRLYRLGPDEHCDNIKDKLKDDVSQKGKLRATLQPTATITGDCPVVEGGGYVGFEHLLYRIEIARVDDPQVMFKWSQFNGGLVGRGDCNLSGPTKRITLTANDQAIKMSGLADFYLEVIEEDVEQGYWRVTYGAEVTLNGDELEIAAERYTEAARPTGRAFLRLWNGILPISNFPKAAAPNELRDGIRLEFDAPGTANYRPGDCWMFEVRASEIANPDILIDDEPPEGIFYHRVPLAVLNWDNTQDVHFDAGRIEDCRKVFRPLTMQGVCCSFTVGDGISSRGDFDSIEEALRHLPASGGEICLLPGLHEANARIEGRRNIKIRGCNRNSKVIPKAEHRNAPIFEVINSKHVTLEHMDLANLSGTAILMRGSEAGMLDELQVNHNRILAHENAIRVERGTNLTIQHNKIRIVDREGAGVAIFVMAEDSLIERNDIGVVPAESSPPPGSPSDGVRPDPSDPCAEPELIYSNRPYLVAYLEHVWTFFLTHVFVPAAPFRALGGIQLAGGSERVRVLENLVEGGAGNGVTLGGAIEPVDDVTEEQEHTFTHRGQDIWVVVESESGSFLSGITVTLRSDHQTFNETTRESGEFIINRAPPGVYRVAVTSPNYTIDEIRSENLDEFRMRHSIIVVESEIDFGDRIAFLYDIAIEGNIITNMGLSGIGIPAMEQDTIARSRLALLESFLARQGHPVVSLRITGNQISYCLRNPFNETLRSVAQQRGLGGISLGLCGDLGIHHNRVENNGMSDLTPVCGIYLSYGEEVDITHNYVVNNGPLVEETRANLIPGKRGGIVISATALAVLDLLQGDRAALTTPRPAARVHDNIVDQPTGQALTIVALGPLSILNNQFISERSGLNGFERLAGTVFIMNMGGLNIAGNLIGTAAPTASVSAVHFAHPVSSLLPSGNTLFNNNQTRLGSASESFAAQLILTFDDLGFDSNQSDTLSPRLQINTLLGGVTLRAGDNRFKELIDHERSFKLSLFSHSSLLNTTTDNQGNHCIIAISTNTARPAININNQVIDTIFCGQLSEAMAGLRTTWPFGGFL